MFYLYKMAFSLKYKPVKLKSGNVIYRPMIPLTLEGNEKIDVFAILDSGSDISIIPKDIATILGIKNTGENEIFGIGGNSLRSSEGIAKISFGKGHEFYSFNIPVFIPEKEDVAIIIGRQGFFEHFDITFSEATRRIIFKKFNVDIKFNNKTV